MMGDLTHPRLIYLKGCLFLLCGALASVALLLERPTPRAALLLALSVWCFARFYYFCFYVVEHYADPNYRYAGLGSLARHFLGKRRRPR